MHADAGAQQSICQPFGEGNHPRLGRRIGRAAAGYQTRHARDIDDGAGACLDHGRQCRTGQFHDGGDVYVEL
ncbi:Uncharacterised protein [Mycobacteroides abscessus subsp. massiliense]|nr:Uncharacterised protein [Mycobacteroides abscessus subsp. massiliense]